jgi:hypothetical protein
VDNFTLPGHSERENKKGKTAPPNGGIGFDF